MSKAAAAVAEIQRMIKTLQAERQKHVDAITEIDATFDGLGLAGEAPKRRGRPAGKKKTAAKRGRPAGRRKKRGSFKVTGEQSILNFVGKAANPPNAKQINTHWSKEGRGGKADNTITKLVQAKQLERIEVKGQRGGRYKLKKK
ncbi:MAG: hypothetical protein RLN76_05915 [Phycisphaeraceae bacterium]